MLAGILGYDRYGNTYVKNCYSMVNITSKITSGNAYIGGNIGYSESSVANMTENLSIGNLYVAGNGVRNVNRIFGGNSNTTGYKNYAYKDQLINGEISNNQLGATKLLSYAEMFQMNTYTNLLGFENKYAYKIKQADGTDLDLLQNEYLPQLNDTNGNVLENQKLTPIDNELKLDSISSSPSSDKTRVTVTMKFENKNNLNLTRVKIENNDMEVLQDTWQTYKDSNGLTVVTFVATPNRAYDSYKIESIFYERNGQEIEKEIITKIKVELFKGISNAKEWNDFFSGDGRNYEGQNVKITGDIDFSTVSSIEKNVVIGKLEADSVKTISNVNLSNLSSNNGFIKEIKTSLKNIYFENCSIQGKANYIGIISILRGAANNIGFNNIIIDSTGNYIGIISRNIAGSFNNITLSNIKCKGNSYTGALCGQTTSLGNSSNIEGIYINVTSTGNYAGGIFGYADGTITNLSAYQYSKNGKQAIDTETSWLVKGNSFVGGAIGQYGGRNNKVTTLKTTNSIINGNSYVSANIGYGAGDGKDLTSENNVIIGTGNYIGGNVGFQGWTYTNLISKNNTITGIHYVGGNSGGQGWSTIRTATSENNKIKGKNYVGGCVGYGESYYSYIITARSKGANQEITGESYVGGVVGRTAGRTKDAKAEDCVITGTGNYVGGVIGSAEYTNTSISSTNSEYYTVSGANAKNVTVTGNMNYVGGITGWQAGTLYGAVLENSTVTCKGSNVGGLVGFYTGYNGTSAGSISSSNFFLWHSYCANSDIKGSRNVGGIAGNFVYGNIQYCYVANTSVVAENNGAGGLVGYFNNSKLSNIQYKATIKYNFIANTLENKIITGNNSVGGLVGIAAKKLKFDEDIDTYNNIECNLIVADIQSSQNYVDMGIGSVSENEIGTEQGKYMNNIYIYDCSYLNGVQVGGIKDEKELYTMVSSGELKTNIYTKNEKILDEEGKVIGNKGLNFGTARYYYNNGYFPILKNSYSANLFWGSSDLNIVQEKIPIPTRVVEFSSDDMSIDEIVTMASEISLLNAEELPDVSVYTSDVDKINIEFESGNFTNAKFKITTDTNIIKEAGNIEKQVYTIEYDFKTPIEITVFNLDYTYTKEIKPEDVQSLLSIVDDEYLYLTENKVYSNKRTIDGTYCNLYKNKVMDIDGNIFEIPSMKKISQNENKISLLQTETAISEFENNGTTIQNYAHSSKLIESNENITYKKQRIFMKNGYMYVIDGKMNNKNGNVIIDSYNKNQYETILGEDGTMYDLLTKIKYPDNFKNENIIDMTSNSLENGNIVLVYYANGKVLGFNYTTGEEVYNNNVKDETTSLAKYIVDSFSTANISYNINKADYIASQELLNKLEKVSVDEATEKLADKNIDITIDENNISQNNKDDLNTLQQDGNNDNLSNNNSLNNDIYNQGSETDSTNNSNGSYNKYVNVYDAETQSYVVYSTDELLKSNAPKSENEKINQNGDLISYYANLSNGFFRVKDFGVAAILVIVCSVCVILVVLYKKQVVDR